MRPQIVIVNLSTSFGGPWREDLCAMGFGLTNASCATHAIHCGGRPLRMVVLCSNGSDQNECMDGARCIRQMDSTIPLILLVGEGSEKLAVAALRSGITDYFHMPAESDSFLRCVRRLAGGHTASEEDQQFLGSSPAMQEAKSRLGRIAQGDANVLITGETGTGKELAASVIHRFSSRRDKPFVCVNCAAIPDALVESELFGYERGAFTGAYTKRAGWLDSARDGTLFLDEVGDLSSVAQAKLLRVVENKSFYRLGGNAYVTTNVRFISATNRDLDKMTQSGEFRQDLFYRLNIARVHLPPLREHRDDIPLMLRHYIDEFNSRSRRDDVGFTDEVCRCLMSYEWPGNIRELKNVLESVMVDAQGKKIGIESLPEPIRRSMEEAGSTDSSEREKLLAALFCTRWNKSKAAERLNWSRMTLYRKLVKHRIVTPK